jgi:hypothetical protein
MEPGASCFTIGRAGISLRVKARPGAEKQAVVGVHGGELVVSVRAAAEKGKANAAIARVLARSLGIHSDSVVLKIGGASRHKVFQLPLEAAAALRRIDAGR